MCLVFVGCGEWENNSSSELSRRIDREVEARANFDHNILSAMESIWDNRSPKNSELIYLILDYLQLEVVRVPAVREKFELKATFIEE